MIPIKVLNLPSGDFFSGDGNVHFLNVTDASQLFDQFRVTARHSFGVEREYADVCFVPLRLAFFETWTTMFKNYQFREKIGL